MCQNPKKTENLFMYTTLVKFFGVLGAFKQKSALNEHKST